MSFMHLTAAPAASLPLHTSMNLGREDLIALELQPGDRLRSDCGTLWVTVDGQAQDVLLGAGRVHTVETGGQVHVSALRSARMVVLGRAPLQWHRVSAEVPGPIGRVAARAFAALRNGASRLARHLPSVQPLSARGAQGTR